MGKVKVNIFEGSNIVGVGGKQLKGVESLDEKDAAGIVDSGLGEYLQESEDEKAKDEERLKEKQQKLLEAGYEYDLQTETFAHPLIKEVPTVTLTDLKKLSDDDFNTALTMVKEGLSVIEQDKKKDETDG
jgi:hypothetical protein